MLKKSENVSNVNSTLLGSTVTNSGSKDKNSRSKIKSNLSQHESPKEPIDYMYASMETFKWCPSLSMVKVGVEYTTTPYESLYKRYFTIRGSFSLDYGNIFIFQVLNLSERKTKEECEKVFRKIVSLTFNIYMYSNRYIIILLIHIYILQ